MREYLDLMTWKSTTAHIAVKGYRFHDDYSKLLFVAYIYYNHLII